jgi:hypothetical protein
MLSDFDLAKQARNPDGSGDLSLMLPGVVESESDGVSIIADAIFSCHAYVFHFISTDTIN